MNYDIDFINDKKHLRLSGAMLNSRYYNYILSAVNMRVLNVLWNKVLVSKNGYYKNGLLMVNIKHETIMNVTGLSKRTVIRCLKRLNSLGVILTIRKKQNNNRYLIGFRTKGNEWILFLYHLINKYEELLSEYIDEHIQQNEDTPLKIDVEMYKISNLYRDYITTNFDSNHFFKTKIKDDKSIMELLFNRNDYHRKPELLLVKKELN